MRSGGIAFMVGEAVVWVLFVQLLHQRIARCFCQYRSGGNRGDLAVALHDCLAGDAGLRAMQAIHQHLLRLDVERQHGAAHRQQGGLQDIELVYFADFGIGHCPSQCALANEGSKPVALAFGKFFGIIQACDRVGVVEYHRCRTYRACQRAAPGFIYAADEDS